MNWCNSCILPDTRPGIIIEADGTCNACRNHAIKTNEIDWTKREIDFQALVNHAKASSKHFDCLIPVSGGKDSTWQVVKCLEYGLRPLAVTWKTPSRTKIGQENLDNLVRLGVDHIDWQVNPTTEKKFLLKSFEKFGATAIPMHMALFNIPLNIATKFKIPIVVWGENSAFEYGSGNNSNLTGHKLDSEWLKKFGVTHGTTAKDWIDDDLTEKEMSSYFGPNTEELERSNVNAIFLGHYFKWDVETSLKVALENGFKVDDRARTGIYNYADIDDDFISIHHWLKWYKFGITRSFDNLSIEIRNKRISRKDAIEKIIKLGEERPDSDIEKFCKFTNISTEKFFMVAESFRNKNIWTNENDHWTIKNFLIEYWNWK
jgi:N-acetyl sugar amidotransferase